MTANASRPLGDESESGSHDGGKETDEHECRRCCETGAWRQEGIVVTAATWTPWSLVSGSRVAVQDREVLK